MNKDLKIEIYRSPRTVFLLKDIAMLTGDDNPDNLKSRINYYVSKGVIRNIRRGIYVKDGYSSEELACRLYSPSYMSLETVLQKEGIIFQYTGTLTAVSYLNRVLTINGIEISYRKIKDPALINKAGITSLNQVNIACRERAVLDALYLYGDFHFDILNTIDRNVIKKLLPVYSCRALEKRAAKQLDI